MPVRVLDPITEPGRGGRMPVAWLAVASCLLLAIGGLVVVRARDTGSSQAGDKHGTDRRAPDPANPPGPGDPVVGGGADTALQFGSPSSRIGTDPEGAPDSRLWLNIAGAQTDPQAGDKYTAGGCGLAGSSTACQGGDRNPLYDARGHLFDVRVASPSAGQPLVIDAFDPAFTDVGDHCEHNLPNRNEAAILQAEYASQDPHIADRYRDGDSMYCTGDIGFGSSSSTSRTTGTAPGRGAGGTSTAAANGVVTTYIVRAPDGTPGDPTDNPAICAISFSPNGGPVFSLLDTTDPANTQPRGLEQAVFSTHFRRWFPVCTVPADQVVAGDYIVQVRTNADLSAARTSTTGGLGSGGAGTLEQSDPNARGNAQNRFALRSHLGTAAGPDDAASAGVGLSAIGHLPLYINQPSATGEFPLARVGPEAAGSTLHLTFYDVGDIGQGSAPQALPGGGTADAGNNGGGSADVMVEPPTDAATGAGALPAFAGCTFGRDAQSPIGVPVSGCGLSGVSSTMFNGHDINVTIPIPADYTCDTTRGDGCWVRVRVSYHGLPYDTTTWSGELVGPGAFPDAPTTTTTGPITTTTAPATTATTASPTSTSTAPTSPPGSAPVPVRPATTTTLAPPAPTTRPPGPGTSVPPPSASSSTPA